MNFRLKDVRWLLALGAAVAVIALSFLTLAGIVTGYAFKLAFQLKFSILPCLHGGISFQNRKRLA